MRPGQGATGSPGAVSAVILDLDETLIHDEAATASAMAATLADATARRGLDAGAAADAVLQAAQRLWRAGPYLSFCQRLGISFWEGLWATFAEGDLGDTPGLRGFAPVYRRAAWRQGLAAVGADDRDLAAACSEQYVWERGRRQICFPETLRALADLRAQGLRLAMLTNGDADLQRRKAAGSGLLPLFDAVVISGEFGTGKPDAAIFRHAASLAGCRPEACVMVGDSVPRDMVGAAGVGMRRVWVDRAGNSAALESELPSDLPAGTEVVTTLSPLPALIEGWNAQS